MLSTVLELSALTAENPIRNAQEAEARYSITFPALALLWQNFWIDRRHWIPESGFQ
jgi:hypothetical protein